MIAAAQPKTPRAARKQYSRSANPSDNETTQQTHNKQRSNRRNNERHAAQLQPQPQPQWQNMQPMVTGQGEFDQNGNFLQGNNTDLDEPPMYEDMEVISGNKRPPKKQSRRQQQHQNGNGNGPPRQNGGISPPRINHYNNQEVNAPAPAISMTPAKPAYAGPTFHASPAASALPLPKFFSKSTPAATVQSSMQARLDQDSDKSDKSDSPPLSDAVPVPTPPPRQEESPLDFFFKADKEEKAKRKSTGLLTTPTSKPAVPHVNSEPPRTSPWAEVYGRPPMHARNSSTGAGKGLFMMELDGSSAPTHHASPPHVSAEQLSTMRSATAPSAVPLGAHHNNHYSPPNAQPIYSAQQYGYSMPQLVPNVSQSSAGPPLPDASSSPFYRPNQPQTPRSAGSTPIQQNNGAYNQQPLHYGNRNLSPVFKAVKQDSVRRTSSLRQEVSAHSPTAGGGPVELPGNSLNDTPSRKPSSRAEQAAMSYLQSHVPEPPTMPKLNLRSTSTASVPTNFAPSELSGHSRNDISPQSSNNTKQAVSQKSIPSTNTIDVKSMEQDLRRILNLNVFGSAGNANGVPSVR